MREDAGENLTDRLLVPLAETTVDATPAEETVYATLAELRDEATRNKDDHAWKHHALLQYGIYKQFLSSPESCRKTVQKRTAKVKARDAESPELPYLEQIETHLSKLTIRDSSRYELLKKQLAAIKWNGSTSSPRVLVFTEYRETQDALAAALTKDFKLNYSSKFEDQPKQALATIHGSCPDIHLMKAVEAFGTGSSKMRMLLATDVASEGINLHHECHYIIHYDLPWSIITLIQRNGRIDRFGQTKCPVLRYLRVRTTQGMLKGDESIFERLIEKVEEINRSTRQGETVLKLYDPEAEERYIAEAGILPGNTSVLEKAASSAATEATDLETVLSQANPGQHEDYLKFLLGETDESPTESVDQQADGEQSRLRLYDDKKFLLEGYRYLAEQNNDYVPIDESGHLSMLTAPKGLRRRLGAPDDRGDVVFGATAIPTEAWPDNNQFRLTDEPEQVELAIKAARNTSGYWSKDLLCTDQHPILNWVTERLLMLMRRGECPYLASRSLDLGELCFCFIGQVSSRAGAPLVVDAHAISFHIGGRFQHRSLREALQAAAFDHLVNEGKKGKIDTAQTFVEGAVGESLKFMRTLQEQREKERIPLLRAEERRLRRWHTKRTELLQSRIEQLPDNHTKARRYKKDLEEMEAYLRDRQENWRDTHFTAATEPSTQLVLAIEGTN